MLKKSSLEIPQKGLIVVLGESGSVKTTFLNCLLGYEPFTEGTIEVNGKTVDSLKAETTIIFQDFQLFSTMNVYENLEIIAKINNIETEKITQVLSYVGLSDYMKQNINTLSGGQKQRVSIARALLLDKPIILADEPTANLDDENKIIIYKLLKALSKEKMILIATHDKDILLYEPNQVYKFKQQQIELVTETLVKEEALFNFEFKKSKTIGFKYIIKLLTSSFEKRFFIRFSSLVCMLVITMIIMFMTLAVFMYDQDKVQYSNLKHYDVDTIYVSPKEGYASKSALDDCDVKLFPHGNILYTKRSYGLVHDDSFIYFSAILVDRNNRYDLKDNEVIVSNNVAEKIMDSFNVDSVLGFNMNSKRHTLVIKSIYEDTFLEDMIIMNSKTFETQKNNDLMNSRFSLSYLSSSRYMRFDPNEGLTSNLQNNEVLVPNNFAEEVKRSLAVLDIKDKIIKVSFGSYRTDDSYDVELKIKDISSDDNFHFSEEMMFEILSTVGDENLKFGNKNIVIDDYQLSDIKVINANILEHQSKVSSDIYMITIYLYSWRYMLLGLGIIMLIISLILFIMFTSFTVEKRKNMLAVLSVYGMKKKDRYLVFLMEILGAIIASGLMALILNMLLLKPINQLINDVVLSGGTYYIKAYHVNYQSVLLVFSTLLMAFIAFISLAIRNNFKGNILDVIYDRKNK